MNVAGIILAAGASRRMGTPKALLEYEGESFVARLRRVFARVCFQVIVVGAPHSPFPADVVNAEPERGMLSSLQAGLAVTPEEASAVLFTPVDLPAILEPTVEALVSGWSGEPLRIPRFQRRRGHPVLIARSLIPEFMAEQGAARDVVSRREQDIVYVDVADPGVVMDVDTLEDYRRLLGMHAQA